jgi:hypothetical protein
VRLADKQLKLKLSEEAARKVPGEEVEGLHRAGGWKAIDEEARKASAMFGTRSRNNP